MNYSLLEFYYFVGLFQMDLEVPCRDTDTMESACKDVKVEPLAFTIDFGDGDNLEEKAKKFERFAQRSSLRKVKSPRQEKDSNEAEKTTKENSNGNEDIINRHRAKGFDREKSNLTRTDQTSQKLTERNVCSTTLSDMERLNIQDIHNAREDTIEDNDEVTSQTGTYIMEEDEELSQVK